MNIKTDVKTLVSDMQQYNTFRISHIKPADNDISSILATSVNVNTDNFIILDADLTFVL